MYNNLEDQRWSLILLAFKNSGGRFKPNFSSDDKIGTSRRHKWHRYVSTIDVCLVFQTYMYQELQPAQAPEV